MPVPKSDDILKLSQTAWKIGRAFSAGKNNAPPGFQAVEVEISGLAKSLENFADSLRADFANYLMHDCDEATEQGISKISLSWQRSVSNLDSLIDQYQIIRQHRTVGGFAIERAWSELVLTQYQTLYWTPEGGNLQDLRDTLCMHTNIITLLISAIQSKTISKLQNMVISILNCTDNMPVSSQSLGHEMDEVQRLVNQLATRSQTPPVPQRNPARSTTIELPDVPVSSSASSFRCQNTTSTTYRVSLQSQSPERPSLSERRSSTVTTPSPSAHLPSRATSPLEKRASEPGYGGSSLRYSGSSYASSDAGTSSVGWPSPNPSRNSFTSHTATITTRKGTPLPRTPELREPSPRSDGKSLPLLPPPAMGLVHPYEVDRVTSHSSHRKLSPYPTSQPEITKLHRSSTTASQKAVFEKEAFRNGAVLCDVRGELVEYSHQINEDDPRDVEMVQASDECRITVVRKRVTDPESRTVRVVTSIWAFSDDGTTRVELRMDDTQMYIPYASYFSPCKVSITLPCELKFHDVKHGNRPTRLAKTTWVNYIFETPQAAALFQNELMGRTLMATFRTEKTMRIHEGLSATFTYAEQMCALENLRIWEDNDTGAIIALIHFSASFRNGYLAFYLNSSVNPIKVKDHGGNEVKIKGLRVPIDRGDKAVRKDSVVAASDGAKGKAKEVINEKKKVEKEKVISGARIEFASEHEKREFLEMCKEVQINLIELPDLLGVN